MTGRNTYLSSLRSVPSILRHWHVTRHKSHPVPAHCPEGRTAAQTSSEHQTGPAFRPVLEPPQLPVSPVRVAYAALIPTKAVTHTELLQGGEVPPSLPFPPGWLYLKRTLIKASENVRFLEIKYLKALPCRLPHPPSNRLSPRQGNACLKAEPVSVFTSPWPSPLEDLPDHELVL